MSTIDQLAGDHIGDLPDTKLQCRSVIGEVRDLLPNPPVGLIDLAKGTLRERFLDLDSEVDPINRTLAVAKCVGHVGIQLGNDEATPGAGPLNGSRQNVDLYTE